MLSTPEAPPRRSVVRRNLTSYPAARMRSDDPLAAALRPPSGGGTEDQGGRPSGWLLGPVPDLLLGCGIGYAVLAITLFFLQLRFGIQMEQIGPWLPLIILVTGIPHYGATLLRIGATAEERQRHGAPAVLWGVAALGALLAGLLRPRFGAVLITLYLSLSPWHYAAQNYGLTMLFLKRRGVPVSALDRRLVKASYLASYLLVLVSYHQVRADGGNDPLFAASSSFRFLPLGLPLSLVRAVAALLFVIYAAALVVSLRRLLRACRLRTLTPIAALLFSQGCWFSVPGLLGVFLPGRIPGRQVALAFIWIALGHCVQYLWISTYYHRHAAGAGGRAQGLGFLARATLLGATLWVVPAVLFAPGSLGRVPFDAGLGLLVAAAVNLHHFALDARIWRLRDPRLSARLVLGQAAERSGSAGRSARRRPPRLVALTLLTVGGLCIFAWIAAAWEREVGYRRAYAARDIERLTCASERLRALGRDGPQIHVALGRLHQARGDLSAAAAAYRSALALDPEQAEAKRRYEQVTAMPAEPVPEPAP